MVAPLIWVDDITLVLKCVPLRQLADILVDFHDKISFNLESVQCSPNLMLWHVFSHFERPRFVYVIL